MKDKLKQFYKKNEVEAWYLLLGFLLIMVLFWQVIFYNKIIIFGDVASDTLHNYLPNYTYYVENLRNLSLRVFDFTLGTGTSIFSMPNFLFDPGLPILLLFPKGRLVDGIFLISILKILGIGFLSLKTLKLHFKGRGLVLIGSLIYAFSGYILVWGQHFQFLINVFWFTLLLYAFERWFGDRTKKVLLIAALAVNVASSLYFAYMSLIFFAVYIPARFIGAFGLKASLRQLPELIKVTVPGFLLAMFSALPQLYILSGSSRTEAAGAINTFFHSFDAMTYASMIGKLFSDSLFGPTEAGEILGIYNLVHLLLRTSVLVILLLPLIAFIRDKRLKFTMTGILTAITLSFGFQFIPLLFNKFAQAQFRWSYVLIPVAVWFILSLLRQLIENREMMERKKLALGLTIVYALSVVLLFVVRWMLGAETISFILTILILTLFYLVLLIFVSGKINARQFQLAILLLVLLEIPFSSLNTMLYHRGYYTRDYLKGETGYYEPDTNAAFEYLRASDGSFYRVEKNYFLELNNDSEMLDYYGFNIYNALPTASYARFNQLVSAPIFTKWGIVITGAADDHYLQNILGKKYAIIKGDEIPYGYELVREFGEVRLYRNLNDLGPVLVYDNSMEMEDFLKLNLMERREVLYDRVVLEDAAASGLKQLPSLGVREAVPAQDVFVDDRPIASDESVRIGHEARVVRIRLADPLDYGTLRILVDSNENLGEEAVPVFVKRRGEPLDEENVKTVYLNNGPLGSEIDLDLDYRGIEEVILEFPDFQYLPDDWVFTLKDVFVEANDTGRYLKAVEGFKARSSFTQSGSTKSSIKGRLEVGTSGMAVISVPYDKGWVLKVDGEARDYQEVNGGFVGFPVEEGVYEVEIAYRQPYLFPGTVLSVAGFGITVALVARDRKIGK